MLGYNAHTETREGPVVTEIIKTAQDLAVDLIALSTHGSSGYVSLMIGSVVNRVLHEARTPVMVLVHPEQDVFHIEPEMMYQAVLAGQSVDG